MPLGGTTMLLLLSPKLTLLTLSLVPLIGVGAIIYRKHTKKVSKILRDSVADAMAFGLERIVNIETVQTCGMEDRESENFSNKLSQLRSLARYAAPQFCEAVCHECRSA